MSVCPVNPATWREGLPQGWSSPGYNAISFWADILYFLFFLTLKNFLFFYNVVWITTVQQSDSVIHTHIHTHIKHIYIIYIYMFFFIFFSIMVYQRIMNIVPMLYSRSLLFFHSMYINTSLQLLISNSQSNLLPPLPPWQIPIYSLCPWFSVCTILYGTCLSLSDLLHLV